jgi:hypothetical protein
LPAEFSAVTLSAQRALRGEGEGVGVGDGVGQVVGGAAEATAVGKDGKEGADSLKMFTQPRGMEDAVVSVISPTEVRLSWTAPGDDLADYNVEHAPVESLWRALA